MRNLIAEVRLYLLERHGVGIGPWGKDFYRYFHWSKALKSLPVGVGKIGFNLILATPAIPKGAR